jgi:hypothetical protein
MEAQDLQRRLLGFAEELRPVAKTPVSVVAMARAFGANVCLRLHTSDGKAVAQLDFGSEPAKIILYRSAKEEGERQILPGEDKVLTARERFSVAHELGHWIAYSRLQVSPETDRRRYWEQERVVNAFAGFLLAPDWLVKRWLSDTPEGTPVSPFALRYWAESECRSSEDVVAKALVRCRSSIGFLRLTPAKRRRDGANVLLVLCCAAGDAVQLPHERSHIDNSRLYRALTAQIAGSCHLRGASFGRCDPQHVRIAWRRGKPLKSRETVWVSLAKESDGEELAKDAAALSLF